MGAGQACAAEEGAALGMAALEQLLLNACFHWLAGCKAVRQQCICRVEGRSLLLLLASPAWLTSCCPAAPPPLPQTFDGLEGREKYPRRWIMLPPFF